MIEFECPKCKARMTEGVLKKKGFRCPGCGYKKRRAWASYQKK